MRANCGADFGFGAAVTLRRRERPGAGFEARLRQPLGAHWPAGTPLHAGVRWSGDFVLTWVWLPASTQGVIATFSTPSRWWPNRS
jgi:hypothetical protein